MHKLLGGLAASLLLLTGPKSQEAAPPGPRPLDFAEANRRASVPTWISLRAEEFDTADRVRETGGRAAALGAGPDERGYFLVQMKPPVTEAAKRSVAGAGVELLDYVPNHAFIVRGSERRVAAAAALAAVTWTGPLIAAWRLDPTLAAAAGPVAAEERRLVVHAFRGVARGVAEEQIARAGATVLEAHGHTGQWIFVVRSSAAGARELARGRDLQWVEPDAELSARNDTTAWTVQTGVAGSTRLWAQGLHGEDQVIGHMDSAMSSTSCYFVDPASNPIGPAHRKIVYLAGPGSSSHGTHTAGTAVGDAFPSNSSTANRGLAWLARIAHTTGFASSNFASVAGTHGSAGARLHTNSWGNDGTTSYNTLCQQIDVFQWENEDHLVLFAATNQAALRNPENAKNLLAIGATRNGTSADTKCSGGAGPTADGRRKPEVFTPGCSIVSAGTAACSTTSQSGTSMACPSAAAAGALVRQYFVEGFHPSGTKVPSDGFTPTGALLKAVLVNSSRDMTGVAGYPSDAEGWGKLVLDDSLYFAGDAGKLLVVDVRRAEGLQANETREYRVEVLSGSVPLEVTLAFTDHPGTINASNPVVNDVDLVVTEPGGAVSYLGNVFAGGWSQAGGPADAKNNVERVAVLQPTAGTWKVTVAARSIPQPGQGFALVVTADLAGRLTAAWSARYGAGKAGLRGIPDLSSGPPRLGSPWTLELSRALENAAGLLLLGLSSAATPFDGGTILTSVDAYLPIATSAAGSFALPLQLPDDPALRGLSLYWQVWIPNDPGAAGSGWAASNGLRTRLGL